MSTNEAPSIRILFKSRESRDIAMKELARLIGTPTAEMVGVIGVISDEAEP